MSDKNDFDYFGKGLTGYVQYKTAFDRSSAVTSAGKASGSAQQPSAKKEAHQTSESSAKVWGYIFLLYAAVGSVAVLCWAIENESKAGYWAAGLLAAPCVWFWITKKWKEKRKNNK